MSNLVALAATAEAQRSRV